MSNKGHRSGGKFGGSHTSIIPLAEILVDSIVKQTSVTKISAGYIKSGLAPANGNRQMKVYDAKGGLRLRIRDNTSRQDILVCTGDPAHIQRILSETAKKKRVTFRLGENADE